MTAVTDQLFYYDPADFDGALIPSATGVGDASLVGTYAKKDGANFSFIAFSGEDGAARFDLPAVGEYTHVAAMRIRFPYTSGDYMHLLTKDADQLDYLIKRLVNTTASDIDPGEIYHYRDQSQASAGTDLFPPTDIWFLFIVKAKGGTLTCSMLTDEGAAGVAVQRGKAIPTLPTLFAGTYSIGRPSDQAGRANEGGAFDLGPFGFFDREISPQEEIDLFNAIFFPAEEGGGATQSAKVSGIVQINGLPAQRTVRAFSYERQSHSIDGQAVNLSRSLGHATSDPDTGEYTIDLLAGYDQRIFVVAFDDYGDDFTPDKTLAVGDRVHPTTPNGHIFECTGAGTLPSEEPTWIVDTETAQLYGTASMIAKPFYRPMVHGPVAPEVTANVQPWTPAAVTTASWLDLSDAANYAETNGKVSTIADISGSGLTLSQSTSAWQPALSSINELPAIQGSGSEYMTSDIGVSIDGGSVLVSAVVSADNFPDDSGDYEALFEILDFGNFSVTNRRISDPQRENIRWALDGSTRLESDYGSYPQIGTAPSVLTLYVIDGQEVGIRLNGTTIGYSTDPSKVSPAAVSGALRLFINTNFSSLKKWRGKLGELVIENNCDSLTEIEKREGYLAHKWKLADFLPNDHAYKSSAPVIAPEPTLGDLFDNGEVGAWYDPSDLTTMFQDTAMSTPVEADGDSVAAIMDKSGNGFHATQGIASRRPIYRTDGSAHWLEGYGNQRLTVPGSATGMKAMHGDGGASIMVATRPGTGSNPGESYGILATSGSSSSNVGFEIRYDDRAASARSDSLTSAIDRGVGSQSAWGDYFNGEFAPNAENLVELHHGLARSPNVLLLNNEKIVTSAAYEYGATTDASSFDLALMDNGSDVFNLKGRFYGALLISRVIDGEDLTRVREQLQKNMGITAS